RFSTPARSRMRQHFFRSPARSLHWKYLWRFAGRLPVSRNWHCSTCLAAVRLQLESSWLDHPSFEFQFFDQLGGHFLGRASQEFGFFAFCRDVNFFNLLGGFMRNTERLARGRADFFQIGRAHGLTPFTRSSPMPPSV